MSIEISSSTPTMDRVRQDFPDWVSPIVVKELRQGLRAKGFTVSLLLLHGVMAMMFMLTLADSAGKGGLHRTDQETVQGFFWFITAVPIVLILPFAGASSINHEMKSKTIELVRMTHLDWLSVVRGKFLSTLVQIALLAVSLLPYFGFRYFFGRVDLIEEIYLLIMVVLLGCLATSCFLVLTVMPLLVKILAWILLIPMFLIGGIGFLFNRSAFGMSLTYDAQDFLRVGMLTLVAAGYIHYLLLLSATLLSKAQYTWSGQKRFLGLIGVMSVLIQLTVFQASWDEGIWIFSMLPLIGMIVFEGLLYRPVFTLRELRDYRRAAGFKSKFAVLGSVKGWPMHVFYVLGLMTVSLLLLNLLDNPILEAIKIESHDTLESFWHRLGIVLIAWLLLASMFVHIVVARLLRLHRVPLFYIVMVLTILMFVASLALGLLTAGSSNDAEYVYFMSVFSPISGLTFLQKAESYQEIFVSVPMTLSTCYIFYTVYGASRWFSLWQKYAKQIQG